MQVAVYLDDVNNAIDNAMQRLVMSEIASSIPHCRIELIDPLQLGRTQATQVLLNQEYDLLLTYNKTGTELVTPTANERVLSKIKRKHVAWLTEHPLTFYADYRSSEGDRHYIFPSASHASFAHHMKLTGTFSSQLFGSTPIANPPPIEKREFDVCIAAQWRGNPDELAFWNRTSGKLREFYEDVLYLQETITTRDTFTAFLAALKHHGLDEDTVLTAGDQLRHLYWYARKRERINLVRALANSGLRIALIGGTEWKAVIPDSRNITYVPPSTYDRLKTWYLRSKCVVTTNNFNGASERVFDGMAAGCVLFSENSPILTDLIGDQNAVFYQPNRAESSVEQLHEALNNLNAPSMAARATKVFLCGHTWTHRANYLYNLFEQLVSQNK